MLVAWRCIVLGELSDRETDEVLRANVIGRIGCHAFGRTYVVPITYVYDGKAIYAHTQEGMKLHMMRENPHVCFEVDHMDDLANWRSVIAWGTFEELYGERARDAMHMLVESLAPALAGPPGASAHPRQETSTATVYRITLEHKSGRFERRA
ncbi:MAG TPA: pyridoxamine 5'-phosphate oxidase family protein [Candidatus Aquilonibacter sp.]|nr:pyridoxamine 5'-phosphate oxidase family protein [Candidatus Aquilonibacter sp.]